MKIFILLLLSFFLFNFISFASVIPKPVTYKVSGPPLVKNIRAAKHPSSVISDKLKTVSGIETDSKFANLKIKIISPLNSLPKFRNDESYSLVVSDSDIELKAKTEFGALHAIETLKQLIQTYPQGLPKLSIKDHPRFPWRGLLIDVVRHWLGPEELKKQIDFMAAVKLNVLHLHLSDDQGFRVESKEWPKLHKVNTDGKYLTQAEVKDLITYAGVRGIRVVPEFDVPGHVSSILAAYPELASRAGSTSPSEAYGVHDQSLNPINEKTYDFLKTLFVEMSSLFPDEFFHVGGDEVTGKHWKENPEIKSYMEKHDIKDVVELQFVFTRRIQSMVKNLGKRMIAWDEVLNEGGHLNSVIQVWRGPRFALLAHSKNLPVLYSYGYYIDLQLSSEDHYLIDPAREMNLKKDSDLLWGGEAAMWSERVNEKLVTLRVWPRTMAIAERLWSPRSVTNLREFYSRQEKLMNQWKLDPYQHLQEKITAESSSLGVPRDSLFALFTWLEPGKFYSQHRYRKFTTKHPLDQFVDTLPSESKKTTFLQWTFNDWLKKKNQKDLKTLNQAFSEWMTIGESLKEIKNEELLFLAKDLALSGRIGKEALVFLQGKERPGGMWAKENRTRLGMIADLRQGMQPAMVEMIHEMVELVAKKYNLN